MLLSVLMFAILCWMACIAIPIVIPLAKLAWYTGIWLIVLPIWLVVVYFLARDEED